MSPFTFPLQINWNSSLQLQFYWRTVIFGKSKSRTFSQRKVFRHKLRISSCSRIYGNYFASRKIWKIFLILSFFCNLRKKSRNIFEVTLPENLLVSCFSVFFSQFGFLFFLHRFYFEFSFCKLERFLLFHVHCKTHNHFTHWKTLFWFFLWRFIFLTLHPFSAKKSKKCSSLFFSATWIFSATSKNVFVSLDLWCVLSFNNT